MRRHPLRSVLLAIWSIGALVYLFIPIGIVILYSFNDPEGRYNLTWEGFTLDHWLHPFRVEGLQEALTNSLLIGALATTAAVILGTFMALALVRYRFLGRSTACAPRCSACGRCSRSSTCSSRSRWSSRSRSTTRPGAST